MNRRLLLGLWAMALFWPFVHSGGYADTFLLALTPLLLALAEAWPHWSLRVTAWLAIVYFELCLSWRRWVSPGALGAAIRSVLHQLLALRPSSWTLISAHASAPFMLMVFLLGWLLFRRCQSYNQALVLLAIGITVICLGHSLWGLQAEFPLASYLIVGLIVLVAFHRLEFGGTGLSVARRTLVNALAAIVVLVPLVVGFELPSHAPLFHGGFLTAFDSSAATTGYGAGITEIDHSLVASETPVFVAHGDAPYYWQAATYNTFSGLNWSNSGHSSTFLHLAGGSDVSLIAPYFDGNHDVHVAVTITDVSSTPLTTLFYTGAPLKFSVLTTVHTRSDRFDANGVKRYSLTSLEPIYSAHGLTEQPFSLAPHSLGVDLEMPKNISPKVARLARTITQGAKGPWDAAAAIKSYLDSRYRYSYQISPAANDVVNEFLFVSHKGYCDQFSTSFIMMMRSLGVPARWVVGYAPGTYVKGRGGYLVRQVDAHSWAQIWIRGTGWVPIDPTPGFHYPTYSAGELTSSRSNAGVTAIPDGTKALPAPVSAINSHVHLRKIALTGGPKKVPRKASSDADEWVVAALVAAVIGVLLWRRKRRDVPKSVTEKQWIDMQQVSRRSFGESWNSRSPREWGQAWMSRFPGDGGLIWPLVRLLETSFYSEKALSAGEEAELKQIWIILKGRALRIRRSTRV